MRQTRPYYVIFTGCPGLKAWRPDPAGRESGTCKPLAVSAQRKSGYKSLTLALAMNYL